MPFKAGLPFTLVGFAPVSVLGMSGFVSFNILLI